MHYLAEYQTFDSTVELNSAIYAHIKRNTYDLNETARATLKAIARYAVKFAGAAHLKAATVAALIGKSEKTARRAINTLTSLGIIEKVATTRRVNGGKGANIFRILKPISADDQSTVSSRKEPTKPATTTTEPLKNENEPSHSINHLKRHNILDTAYVASEALKNVLPSAIYDAMSPYFNAEELYEKYGILLRAKSAVNKYVRIEDNPEPFVIAFKNAVLKLKQGKIRNLENYLYAAWKNATVRAELYKVAHSSPSPNAHLARLNWLE